MTAPVPSREPDKLSAGTTWTWRRDDLSDYPANGGWSLSYAFAMLGAQFVVNGGMVVASGASFLVTVPVATTSPIVPGTYTWGARVADGGGNVYEAGRGRLLVLPSLVAGADPRTHARKVLDAIEAAIEGRASRTDLQYEIGGQRLAAAPVEHPARRPGQAAADVSRRGRRRGRTRPRRPRPQRPPAGAVALLAPGGRRPMAERLAAVPLNTRS
jgi:hypothetical protein